MKKITFLLALFCMLLSTATAQTRVPSSTLLTVDQLNSATENVYLAIKCISGTNRYWYCGNKSVESNTNQEIIFVWEPSGDNESHYLKKYIPTAAQGEGYLQANGNGANLTIGAKSSAQKFKAVTATLPGSSDPVVEGTNTDAGYIVRFAEAAGTAYWINVQTPTGTPKYNTGQGLYTMYNVYQAEETNELIVSAIFSWKQIANTKLFTLSTSRSELTVSNDYTQGKTRHDIHGTFDADNERYQWAILKHATNGNYYLYNKAANKFLCKDASMSTTPTDAVQNVSQTDGTFVLKFDNTHYINMGGSKQLVINDWGTADAGNKFTITHVANWEPSEDLLLLLGYGITVTINYNVGAKNYLSTTILVKNGTTLSASDFNHLSATKDYVTVSDWDKKDPITEDCTVNVSCTYSNDCPLVFSESFENAKWQMVNMHSNESNYVWSVNLSETGQPTINVINKGGADSYKSSVAPEDKDLWAFVGDITGFQIYNKAAGASYVMSKPTDGDNAVSWTAPADGTIYTAHRTASTSISNGASILPKGHTYYLNHRVTNIQGWTARDEGSTVRIFAPDAFLMAYNDELPPVGALGSSSYFIDETNASNYLATLATLDENHYNVAAAQTLSTILTAAAEADPLPNDVTANTYYRLYNAQHKAFVTSGHNGENEDALQGIDKTAAISTAGTIVKFEKQEDNNYKLYTQGLGFGNVTASTQVLLDDSGLFEITNDGSLYAFRDVNNTDDTYNYLHYQADGKIVGWDNGATTTASKWYLVPANELVVELNPVGDRTYASTYLPYDFTIGEGSGVRAYKVTHTEGEVAKTMEVADIEAEQGVILVGESAEKTSVRLYIGTATSDFSDNILFGTTTSLTIDEEYKRNFFVLGNGSNGVGFYNPNSTTLKENRAYLTADYVTGDATNGLRLEFGGETTGIVATETLNNVNAPIYDLSGRRVANPVKGIYVKGGKKIYVK